MKKGRRGFTLVEVAIFLAITGILFIGITVGVQNSVYQQRRNDSVQSFIEFLRNVYSEVENVQNSVPEGRSEKAIYGKLVTFGESLDLEYNGTGDQDKMFVYTVVGDVGSPSGDTLVALKDLHTDILYNGQLMGYPETFIPKWGSTIDPACPSGSGCDYKPLKASLLVVRHPSSGVVYTYYKSGVIDVNALRKSGASVILGDFSGFGLQQVDFCVNPEGRANVDDRMDVRIVNRAHNASAIEQVPDYDNLCGARKI